MNIVIITKLASRQWHKLQTWWVLQYRNVQHCNKLNKSEVHEGRISYWPSLPHIFAITSIFYNGISVDESRFL